MTAAEQFARRERAEILRAVLTHPAVVGATLGVIIGLAFAYCSGVSKGKADALGAVRDSVVKSIEAQQKVVEQNATVDSAIMERAIREGAASVAKRATVAPRVVVVSDTVLRVDTQTVYVPQPVVQLIRADSGVIAAQAVELSAVHRYADDVTQDRDLWKHRALIDEAALKSHRSRFGFKTGAVVGALAVGSLAYLLHK